VVESCVLARVDPAEAGLPLRRAEAVERAAHAGKGGRGDSRGGMPKPEGARS
jgi:hypothetical protein